MRLALRPRSDDLHEVPVVYIVKELLKRGIKTYGSKAMEQVKSFYFKNVHIYNFF